MSLRRLPTWLANQKAVDLRSTAVLSGIPSSGTKQVLVQNIQNTLLAFPRATVDHEPALSRPCKVLSVVNIDMGIRNLAYTHWTASLQEPRPGAVIQYERPSLTAWRKMDISKSKHTKDIAQDAEPGALDKNKATAVTSTAPKESFEPIEYASHAYRLIKSILDEHKPSHVTIERQRFRTGGLSAVQEWTIRVGVFEGMLYAVLKTLVAEHPHYAKLCVEPILPVRVNNYWSDVSTHTGEGNDSRFGGKKSSREVKQAKIDLVRELLESAEGRNQDKTCKAWFAIGERAADMASSFLASKKGVRKNVSTGVSKSSARMHTSGEISKFDDLADSFLQGLAWLHWQNNQLRLAQLPEDTKHLPVHWNTIP